MRTFLFVFIAFIFITGAFTACQKYQDPPATTDPRLTNPYCNNPYAVNYNVGFPGRPDDSVCLYPSDLFRGTYIYNDSIYTSDNTFLGSRADTLMISDTSEIHIMLKGFCGSNVLLLTANAQYIASLDTTIMSGQPLCRIQDTVNGTLIKNQYDTTALTVSFMVLSDTGTTFHKGTAIKQ